MQAQPKTIREILHTGDQYIIPLFQRFYSWDKTNWERLRLDVWALMEDGAKPVHFLGPLVCTLPPRLPGNASAFQLIDGQQRVTTLTILLAAVRDVARSRGLADLAEEVTEYYLLFKRKQGNDRYKVLPRLGDREVLTAMVEGHDMSRFEDSRVFEAWKYFHRHVQHLSRKDTEKQLVKLLDVITTRLNLVAVLIDGENPYEIFESLNSTGLPLRESDLIRNFVFMAIELDRQQEFNEKHWKSFEEMFDATDEHAAVEMTPFYRDYLMRNGQYTKEDATFVDFKLAQDRAKKTPDVLVAELKHFARLDLMLRRPAKVKDASLRRLLRQIDGMDMSTAYPLLLNLLDRHDRGTLSKDELCGCLHDLISFVLRRSICGETTRNYSRWFVEAITMIRNSPRADLQAYWLGRRWPDDAAVQERLVSFELYRSDSRKTRVILEALEESFGHHERADLHKATIEHVMPQTISNNKNGKAWKEMLGADWEAIHESLLHTLGNLTLTGYNTELSNAPYEAKRAEFAKSHFDLNRYFTAVQKWSADAVRQRSVELAKQVVSIWPRPASAGAYLASAEAMPEPEGLSNSAKQRLEYWRQLDSRLEERGMPPELISPAAASSVSTGLGESGEAQFTLSFNQQRSQIHVTLELSGKVGARIARGLEAAKDAIHQELGYQLTWGLGNNGGEIYTTDEGIPIRDLNDWPVQHDWFGDRLDDFLRVLKPRVLALEAEALKDPELRKVLENRDRFAEFWRVFAQALSGSKLSQKHEAASGRSYFRFHHLDTGIRLGLQVGSSPAAVTVYLGVAESASRKQRNTFKDLSANHRAALDAEVGERLDWNDRYCWASLPADIANKADWPHLHQWLKKTAEKIVDVFKPRLGIE